MESLSGDNDVPHLSSGDTPIQEGLNMAGQPVAQDESGCSYVLPANTEVVFVETEDGHQEIQLIDTETAQVIDLDPQVAEHIKRQLAGLCETDVLQTADDSVSDTSVTSHSAPRPGSPPPLQPTSSAVSEPPAGCVSPIDDSMHWLCNVTGTLAGAAGGGGSTLAQNQTDAPASGGGGGGSVTTVTFSTRASPCLSLPSATLSPVPSMPSLSAIDHFSADSVPPAPIPRPFSPAVSQGTDEVQPSRPLVGGMRGGDMLASACCLALMSDTELSPLKVASPRGAGSRVCYSSSAAGVLSSTGSPSCATSPRSRAARNLLSQLQDEIATAASTSSSTTSAVPAAAAPVPGEAATAAAAAASLSTGVSSGCVASGAVGEPAPAAPNTVADTAQLVGDTSAAGGFVRVVVTRPDGEKVVINVPSSALRTDSQPTVPVEQAAPDQSPLSQRHSEQAPLSPPVNRHAAPSSSSCGGARRHLSPWQRFHGARRRARRRASRGVSRAVAALRRTQDSDASFSDSELSAGDDKQQQQGYVAQGGDRERAAPVGRPSTRGRCSSQRRSRIDALFRCVLCSTLWRSASELHQHVATAHDTEAQAAAGDGVVQTDDPHPSDGALSTTADGTDIEEASRGERAQADTLPVATVPEHAGSSSPAPATAPATWHTTAQHRGARRSQKNDDETSGAVCGEPTLNVDIIPVDGVRGGGADWLWECAECDAVFQLESELRVHNDQWHMPDVESSDSCSSGGASDADSGGDSDEGGRRRGRRVHQRQGGRGRIRYAVSVEVVRAWLVCDASGGAAGGGGVSADTSRWCGCCDKRFGTVVALADHILRCHRHQLSPDVTAAAEAAAAEGCDNRGAAAAVCLRRRAKTEFTCHVCRMTYTSIKVFQRHLRTHPPHQLQQGGQQLVQSDALPQLAPDSAAQFACDKCDAVFDSSRLLSAHGQAEHPPLAKPPRAGPARTSGGGGRSGRPCGSSDAERQKVYDQIESRQQGFACRMCDFVGRTKYQAFYHVSTKHIVLGGAVCDICQRSFYSEALLRIHRRSHTGERPFICQTCGHAFRQNADLQSHMRSRHSNIRPFTCEVCGKSFSRRYSCTVHMRCHTDERNYPCPYCDKRFRASTYLTAHLRVHTGERSHACPICHKRFRLQSDIRRHIFVHSRDKIPRNQRRSQFLTSSNENSHSLDKFELAETDLNQLGSKTHSDGSEVFPSVWNSANTIFTYDDGTMLVTVDGNEDNTIIIPPNSSNGIM